MLHGSLDFSCPSVARTWHVPGPTSLKLTVSVSRYARVWRPENAVPNQLIPTGEPSGGSPSPTSPLLTRSWPVSSCAGHRDCVHLLRQVSQVWRRASPISCGQCSFSARPDIPHFQTPGERTPLSWKSRECVSCGIRYTIDLIRFYQYCICGFSFWGKPKPLFQILGRNLIGEPENYLPAAPGALVYRLNRNCIPLHRGLRRSGIAHHGAIGCIHRRPCPHRRGTCGAGSQHRFRNYGRQRIGTHDRFQFHQRKFRACHAADQYSCSHGAAHPPAR